MSKQMWCENIHIDVVDNRRLNMSIVNAVCIWNALVSSDILPGTLGTDMFNVGYALECCYECLWSALTKEKRTG